jgi:ABC-2 type transport system permease protein
MWNDFKLLLGVHMRMRFRFSALRDAWRTGGKERNKLVGMTVAFAYVGVVILAFYVFILYALLSAARAEGAETLIFGGVAVASMLGVMLFGIVSLLGLVLNAKDAEAYASMPLRPGAVFAAKFAMVYLTELAFAAVLLIPATILYAVLFGAGDIWLFLRLIPLVLLAPTIPLGAASLVALPLSRLSVLFRRREAVAFVSGLLLIAAALGGNVFLNTTVAAGVENPMELLNNTQGLLEVATQAFPPARWLANALLMAGETPALDFALLALLSAALLLAALVLANRMYLRAVVALGETPKKAAKRREGDARQSPVRTALFLRELRSLTRSSVYALNALSGVFIFPIMLFVLPMLRGDRGSMEQLVAGIQQANLRESTMVLLAAALLSFVGGINPAATTLISRQGRSLSVLRSLPVDLSLLVRSGHLLAMCLSGAAMLLSAAALAYLNLFPLYTVLLGLCVALSANWGATALSMLPDIQNPKLDWGTEAEAIKQNFNSVWGMVYALLLILAYAVPAVGLWLLPIPLPAPLYGILLTALFAVLGHLLLNHTAKKSQKLAMEE